MKTPWGWSRWLRLIVGVAFIIDAFFKSSGLVGFMGAFLVYQALFNVGCGLSQCSPSPKSAHKYDISHNFIDLNKK
jgi:hypothetical protein